VSVALSACRAGALSPTMALMHLCMECESPAAVAGAIAEALARDAPSPALAAVAALARARPDAWSTVRRLAAVVDHAAADIETFAASFDRAAALSPEGSVALYSLGDPALLEAATSELLAWLDARRLLGPGRSVLDLGCGIGRLAGPIAGRVDTVAGADVSGGMLSEARARWRERENLLFVRTSGRDLAAFADAAFDMVVAVDSFPYMVAVGPALAARHVEECARVLRAGGDLVIFNFSYRGDLAADRADLAGAPGLRPVESGTRDLAIWDAPVFHLQKA
jgi:SAM-dependent methyltransferase